MTNEPYHHGNLRQALLDAAAGLLAEKGPDEVSTRAVAKLVGVSHNAPYRHFASRDAMLAGLAQQGFEGLIAAFEVALAGNIDPRLRMIAVSEAYVAYAVQHPSIYLLMFSHLLNKLAFPELEQAAGTSLKIVCDVVVELRGETDAELHARGAWAMVHGIATLLIEDRLLKRGSPDALLALALENYITGMMSK